MYGSFGAIWVGFRKNAYAGMDYQPHKFVVGAIVALLLAWAPLATVGLAASGRTSAAVGVWGMLAQVVATIPNLIFVGAAFRYALGLAARDHRLRGNRDGQRLALPPRSRASGKGRAIDASTVLGSGSRQDASEGSEEIPGQVSRERR